MAKLRMLCALLLIVVGTTLAGIALSGYFEPPVSSGWPVEAANEPSISLKTTPAAWRPTQGLVAKKDERAAAKQPAKLKSPKRTAKAEPAVKDRRPRQTAAQWPWSLFTN